ncbi:MAG TPA: hypothetical protein VM940_09575 [Chthoniobacterales bacterium]|jgi:hypothetical protein|nr:hypothetical protein [Chthoniobacterales bacterium]
MKTQRLRFFILLVLLGTMPAFGSVSGVGFVYQPLTTFGTDADPKIIVAKVPIIASGPLENVLVYIAAPNRLPQRGPEIIEDSNLLSLLAISVEAEWVEKPEHYVATLNLSQMKAPDQYDLTDDDVVKAAVKCIRGTIDELGMKKPWKIRITPRSQDDAKWRKYETDYRPHPRK